MKKQTKRDYVAKLMVYDLDKMDNKDIIILSNWLHSISESKIKPDSNKADKIITYKLMK